ncbi:MAG: phosphoglycerate kinase [Candidatus Nanopelagicales bacterium]|nr:phosphoglycerate kinase [Candidatus Nanopelagicales bacterium]
MIRGIDDLEVSGKVVFVRCDLNVPLEAGHITDDGRIRASLPTLKDLADRGARVVVLAHLGRPKGTPEAKYSLAPAALRLGELLGSQVPLARDVCGTSAQETISALANGQIAMLENVRFDARETGDAISRQELAKAWAELGDLYVSDGFGVVHREQASVTDLANELPHAAGLLVKAEADVFAKVLSNPERPYAVVLGGSKVSDKLKVIDNLISNVDRLLIGGGMCFTFLAAKGYSVGSSLLEIDQIENVKEILNRAEQLNVEIVLPTDIVVADAFAADAQTQVVSAASIPDGWMGLDIGPDSIASFEKSLADAKTIMWNGPMGVFEMSAFAAGTKAVAVAMTKNSGMTVVGGGDSAAAVRLLGIDESGFSHISTGGGASLEYLEGKELPGLSVLEDN